MIIKRTKLAAAVSAVCAVMATQTHAQDTQLEEVVVTGIRGSLTQALDIKRNTPGVMDAISAEDIGKFPDTNLAESLQRITGVSVNRVEGEGSEVTIRGFSGDFNLVTLNGRQMPSADNNVAFFGVNSYQDKGDSRSFDFSNIASEGVSGLQVYKTGRASAPSGGLGGSINIQTIRPLEAGNQFSLGTKAVDDAGGDSITPEFSGLASWVNDAGTFGVTGFASHQERDYSNRSAIQGGVVWTNPFTTDGGPYGNAVIVNPPSGQLVGFPNSSQLSYTEGERERTNASVTLQFAPSDDLTVTVDGLFARNDQVQQSVSDLPFFIRQFDFVQFDGNPVVSWPEFISEPHVAGAGSDPTQAGKELPFRNTSFSIRDELTSFGINVDYQLNDSWTLNVDAATSEATAGGNGNDGAISESFSLGGQAVAAQFVDFRTEIPNSIQAIADGSPPTSTMVDGTLVNFPGGNANGIFEKSDLGSQWAFTEFREQKSTLDQFNLKAGFDNGGSVTANFGLGYYDNEIVQKNLDYRDELGGWNTNYVGDIVTLMGEDAIETVNIRSKFNDHDGLLLSEQELVNQFTAAGGTIADGANLRLVGEEAYFIDPVAFMDAFDGFTSAGGSVFDRDNPSLGATDDNTITEDVLSVYAEVVLDGEVATLPMQVVAGLRYEDTGVESASVQSIPQYKEWASDNDFNTIFGSSESLVTQEYDYDNILPNLDLSVDVNDNLKLRSSLSTTIARPPLGAMFVATNAGSPNTATALGGTASGSRGNAELDPLESNNFDLSAEYYYGEGSAFTIAYFNKEISNFLGTEQVTTNLFGLRDVSTGAPGTRSGQAIAELQARGYAVTETNLFTMTAILDNPADFPNGADDYIDPSEPGGAGLSSTVASTYTIVPNESDPLMQHIVQQPTNAEKANINGWEVNLVHFFEGRLQGFGFQANATFVSGDVGFDNSADPDGADQFALTGLSDSWNLIAFYENDTWSARVLFNSRDEFLASTNVGNRVPRYVDPYQQLDFNVGYSFNDNLTFTLEGINMLEEAIVYRGRTDANVQSYIEGDRRIMLGARYVW